MWYLFYSCYRAYEGYTYTLELINLNYGYFSQFIQALRFKVVCTHYELNAYTAVHAYLSLLIVYLTQQYLGY